MTLEQGGCPVDTVRACGSGAANSLWVRIIANVTGKPVLVSAEKDATCLGSAVCAAVAGGLHGDLAGAAAAMAPPFETIEPDVDIDVYESCFGVYLRIYQKMKGTMAELARMADAGGGAGR